MLGPPLAWAGYTFLRDAELEGYQGASLVIRSLACGLVYALLWGVFCVPRRPVLRPDAFTKGLEIWQMVVLVVPVFAAGTLAAYASFDLDPGSAFFHCAMYFAVTVLLRLVAGLPAIPGLGADVADRERHSSMLIATANLHFSTISQSANRSIRNLTM